MPEFTVGGTDVGLRLDVVVAAHSGLSRALVQRLVVAGAVTVDDAPAGKRRLLREGERVAYEEPATGSAALAAEPVAFTIVYEDDDLLVVDKPAGVIVHPAPGHEHGTLVQGLLPYGIGGGNDERPGVVHRLDRDTSGLLIVARNHQAHQRLVAALLRRDIHRRYLCLACGTLPQERGTIDVPIGRHVRDRTRISVHSHSARNAVTHFAVRERLPGYTYVDVRLETGRTHQIRVHLAALGHPVAGDIVYGNRHRPEGLERQFLHAARLEFAQPTTGEPLAFEAPLPPDLAAFLVRLCDTGQNSADF